MFWIIPFAIALLFLYRHFEHQRDDLVNRIRNLDRAIQHLRDTLSRIPKGAAGGSSAGVLTDNWTSARVAGVEERLSRLQQTFDRLMEHLIKRYDIKDVRDVPLSYVAPSSPVPPVSPLPSVSPIPGPAFPAAPPTLPLSPLPPRTAPEPAPIFVGNDPYSPGKSAPENPSPIEREKSVFAVDWEKFTGAQLFSWIGGFALFLGAVFFVKYSIDQGWLSPFVRVVAGLVLGVGALWGGLKMRNKNYAVTAHTLSAAGVAILYADAFAAHSLYHFIPAGVAFLFMMLVTTLAFLLSVRADSRYIAILGMVGGFLTPPLVSTGVDRPFGLFSYIALLDIGLAAVALQKRWGFLLGFAAGGTLLMQAGWVEKFFEVSKAYTGSAIFLFFPLLFLGIWAVSRRQQKEDAWSFYPAAALPILSLFFGAYMLGFRELGQQPGLVLSFIFLLDLMTAVLAFQKEEARPAHLLAGGLSFLFLMSWTLEYLSLPLLPWGLAYYFLFAALHAVFPVALQRAKPTASPFIWGHLYPLLMLTPVLVAVTRELTSPALIWPAVFLIDVVAVAAAILTQALWALAGVIILTMIVAGYWLLNLPDLAGLSGLLGVIGAFSLLFFGMGIWVLRGKNKADSSEPEAKPDGISQPWLIHLPALSAVLPFLLMVMASTHLPLLNPSSVFGLGILLIGLLLGLVLFYRVELLAPVTLGSAALLQYAWHFRHFQPESPLLGLLWYLAYWLIFLLFPFLFKEKIQDQRWPWATAAFAGPIYLWLFHNALAPHPYIGLLPAFFAVVYLAALGKVLQRMPVSALSAELQGQAAAHRADTSADAPYRQERLALFGGVALFFISLIFPLQFDREWITLGWALEGMALVGLYHRIPHPGLKIWGVGLLAVAFVRLAFNPAVFAYHPRQAVPILNWYLYTYGIAAACFFLAAKLWRPVEETYRRTQVRPILMGLGAVLLFLLLNIEIADFFSTGTNLTFRFSGSIAQDMTYTLGWSLFGFALLVLGIRSASRGARLCGMGLLSVTVLKLFLHDLWRLGQLYRVGAFVGLAGILILASFLYQRYLSKEK